jgi:hypothetical protein
MKNSTVYGLQHSADEKWDCCCGTVAYRGDLANMFRRATFRLAEANPKMQTLHKLLTGETQFKNKGLLKQCNVEAMFGAQWAQELDAYAKTLSAKDQDIIKRQVERLSLTRYTTRELAQYAVNGPTLVDQTAQASLIADGVNLRKEKGDAEFKRIVADEAKLGNWDDAKTKNFISAVEKAAATA